MKILRWLCISIVAILLILAGGFKIYTDDFYHASTSAKQINWQSNVKQDETKIIYQSENPKQRILFFPGGKVAPDAYANVAQALAKHHTEVIVVKMPFNLAMFGMARAEKIMAQYHDAKPWILMGHSLGGVFADKFADDHADKVQKTILLASYPDDNKKVKTLSIYGSNDGLLNTSKLVTSDETHEIKGANHAQFGNYGKQAKDKAASISMQAQIDKVIEILVKAQVIDANQ